MNCRHLLIILAILLPSCAIVSMPKDDVSLFRARQLNQELLILDTHLDTPSKALKNPEWALHQTGDQTLVDLPRMRMATRARGPWRRWRRRATAARLPS